MRSQTIAREQVNDKSRGGSFEPITAKMRLAKTTAALDKIQDIVRVIDRLFTKKVITVVSVAQLIAVDALQILAKDLA